MELPQPDTHCHDDDTGLDVWSYSHDLVRSIVAAAIAEERESIRARLLAMNGGAAGQRNYYAHAVVVIFGEGDAARARSPPMHRRDDAGACDRISLSACDNQS